MVVEEEEVAPPQEVVILFMVLGVEDKVDRTVVLGVIIESLVLREVVLLVDWFKAQLGHMVAGMGQEVERIIPLEEMVWVVQEDSQAVEEVGVEEMMTLLLLKIREEKAVEEKYEYFHGRR